MKQILIFISFLFLSVNSFSQVKNIYTISFDNVKHHEAQVTAKFKNVESGTMVLQMAQKSPGSYGMYNFSKNIYDVKITGSRGKDLRYTRVSLNRWRVDKHDGEINVSYKIFGDKADGVFSQFSEDQTIVNNPSTFMYINALASRPVQITYENRKDLKWKIATQLEDKGGNKYEAENLQEFMDSPALLANFELKERTIESGEASFKLKLAIKHKSEPEAVEALFEKLTKIAEEQRKVFGSFPDYEYGSYTFIASYSPGSSVANIEHRNSSLIINDKPLDEVDQVEGVKAFSEVFLKSWNKKRIAPVTLKTFDFQDNTLTSEYWLTEGFSNYYGLLTMCRAGILSHDEFLEESSFIINNVITSSASQHNNAIEMSKKALSYHSENSTPYASNLYIPYEDHGFLIALILDLELRDKDDDLSLDDFMNLLWSKYGKTGRGYSVENIQATLKEYTSESFSDNFFKNNITEPGLYDVTKLLETVGVMTTYVELPFLGVEVKFNNEGKAEVSEYTIPGTPGYEGGLEKGDIILSIEKSTFSNRAEFKNVISGEKIATKITVFYSRKGIKKSASIKLLPNPNLILTSDLNAGGKESERRNTWIGEEK